MGMIIDGTWRDEDDIIQDGAFVRTPSQFADDISGETIAAIGAEPGRFLLIGSMSCPWSQRTMLVRALKGLEDVLPLHIAGGPRVQGYALDGGQPWRVLGAGVKIVHLHQLYALADPHYTGRATVPVLWDSKTQSIISNESAKIMRALNAVPTSRGLSFTLVPSDRSQDIDTLNRAIAQGLSEAVYRAGFAQAQGPYDAAVEEVFALLDGLEGQLSQRRYLLGQEISEADLRLFPTLVRFDAVYHILHKCSRRRLIDYPHLWAYARDLFSWRGIASTVDFDALREAAYQSDFASNPFGIVAAAPDVDWTEPHGREALGPAQVALRCGARVTVDPVQPSDALSLAA